MALTQAQLVILKADILADPVLAAQPDSNSGTQAIVAAYNAPASPAFQFWNTAVPLNAISNAIDMTKYTPVDASAGSLTDIGNCFRIEIKQINLQNILQSPVPFDASKSINRANLRDSVITIPAGAAGALISAGGAGGKTVLTACLKVGTRYEKLFSSGTETTGTTPNDVTGGIYGVDKNGALIQGGISGAEIEAARSMP